MRVYMIYDGRAVGLCDVEKIQGSDAIVCQCWASEKDDSRKKAANYGCCCCVSYEQGADVVGNRDLKDGRWEWDYYPRHPDGHPDLFLPK